MNEMNECSLTFVLHCSACSAAHGRMQSGADLRGQIRTVTICGSIGPICGSVVTVALRLGLGLGLGLRIVVYKLLEKVIKCGSVT